MEPPKPPPPPSAVERKCPHSPSPLDSSLQKVEKVFLHDANSSETHVTKDLYATDRTKESLELLQSFEILAVKTEEDAIMSLEHVEREMDSILARDAIRLFLNDLDKKNWGTIDESALEVIRHLSRVPTLSYLLTSPLQEAASFSPNVLLLSKILEMPTFELYVGSTVYKVDTHLFAVHSDRIKAELLSPMTNRQEIDLSEFTPDDIRLLRRVFISPDYPLETEDAWRLLILSTKLQAITVEKKCLELLVSYIQTLDPSSLEDMDEALVFLNALYLNDYPELNTLVRKYVSEFIKGALKNRDANRVVALTRQLESHVTIDLDLSNLKHLKDADLICLSKVKLNSLNLENCSLLTGDCLDSFSDLSFLQAVHLGGNKWVNNEFLQRLPSSITVLDLNGTNILAKTDFSRFTALKKLSLKGTNIDLSTLQTCPPSIVYLNLSDCKGITSEADFSRFSALKILLLKRTTIDDATLQTLPPSVMKLKLVNCTGITSRANFSPFTALKVLDLSETNIGDSTLGTVPPSIADLRLSFCTKITSRANFGPFISLKVLVLSGTKIDDSTLQTLPPSIEELNLYFCKNITFRANFSRLTGLIALSLSETKINVFTLQTCSPLLEELYLNDCESITPQVNFSHFLALKILHIKSSSSNFGTPIPNSTIQNMPPSLEELSLDCWGWAVQANFSRFTALKILTLYQINIDNSTLQTMPPSLEKLDLGGCGSFASLANFSRFTALKVLNLSATDSDDAVLQTVPPSIEDLSLSDCKKITYGFSPFTALKRLLLDGTNIDDSTLETISPSIEELAVDFCARITSEANFSRFTALKKLNLDETDINDSTLETIPPSIEELSVQCDDITPQANFARFPAARIQH